jgi:ketosteroid isomerase-like protein
MNRSDVQAWLDGYVEAWRNSEPEAIRALFSEKAVYRYRPHLEGRTLQGSAAIVEGWLEHTDDPDDWSASYEVFAVDEDRAVAIGTSRYFATEDQVEAIYDNCFLLRFARDGRCIEFVEYWMLEPTEGNPG